MKVPPSLTGKARDTLRIERDRHGVPHIIARSEADLYRGLGYCHGSDRALQMSLVRVLAEGRAAEHLAATEEMVASDIFFRRLGLAVDAEAEAAKLSGRDRDLAQAYCEGVNCALERRLPWELRILRYTPRPWSVADAIVLSRVIGYVALAQSQAEMERLLVELIQRGVSLELLQELFPGSLEGADFDLLRKVKLGDRIVPQAIGADLALPKIISSNNWVLSGRKTASASPLLANDPHLEANRLPAVWYEVVLEHRDRFCIAGTMPGLPGALIGRTNDLAWGATYSFMDAIDSWVEHCRDGCYRRSAQGRDRWEPFRVRRETIKRKRGGELSVSFYENDHGVLDGDPHEEGFYLATRWSVARATGAASLAASFRMLEARDVHSGMEILGEIETAWNWVLADRHGNIGYQMSGRMPVRRPTWDGLLPAAGWDPENDWRGFVPPKDLPRALNPECGFIATANNDLNPLGRCRPINLPMGPYRAQRIEEALERRGGWTVEDTLTLQLDLYSPQAEAFMEILRPLLPATPQGRLLGDWDCRYGADSKGAYLFERFYAELVREVFSSVGGEIVDFIAGETGLVADFYYNFDRILLAPKSAWFGSRSREEIYRDAASRALKEKPRTWGSVHRIEMKHLLFGGKLPSWLGFDFGPLALPGSRATICQGQIYTSGKRQTSFAPSFRLITDLSQNAAHTSLAGGPSDRRFSRWYASGIDDWAAGRLKRLEPLQGTAPAPR